MATSRRSQRDIDNANTAGTMTVMTLARKLADRGAQALVVQKRSDGRWHASVRRPDGVGPHADGVDIAEAIVHLMALIDAG